MNAEVEAGNGQLAALQLDLEECFVSNDPTLAGFSGDHRGVQLRQHSRELFAVFEFSLAVPLHAWCLFGCDTPN